MQVYKKELKQQIRLIKFSLDAYLASKESFDFFEVFKLCNEANEYLDILNQKPLPPTAKQSKSKNTKLPNIFEKKALTNEQLIIIRQSIMYAYKAQLIQLIDYAKILQGIANKTGNQAIKKTSLNTYDYA